MVAERGQLLVRCERILCVNVGCGGEECVCGV